MWQFGCSVELSVGIEVLHCPFKGIKGCSGVQPAVHGPGALRNVTAISGSKTICLLNIQHSKHCFVHSRKMQACID